MRRWLWREKNRNVVLVVVVVGGGDIALLRSLVEIVVECGSMCGRCRVDVGSM